MGRTEQKYTWNDHLFNISLVLFFILPQNELLYYFVPVAMVYITDWHKPQKTNLRTLKWILLGSLALTLFTNVMSSWVTSKSLLRLIDLGLLLLCFGRLKRFIIIKEYLVFLVIYLITFQFAYQLNIPVLGQLLQSIYPLSEEMVERYAFREDLGLSDFGGVSSRLGGIYYNSNNCASFLEMLFVLIVNERKQFKKWVYIALLALNVLGIVSTGSRTSLLVLVMLMILMFSVGNKTDRKYVVIFLIVGLIFFQIYGASSRMFMVREGMDSSFSIKVGILADYLQSISSPLRLLFGCLSGSYLVQVLGKLFPGTDFDIGDVTVAYGFAFDILLLCFLWYLYKNLGRYKSVLCILVWCFSNTIFMSYRGSAIFLLIASMYYSKNLLERGSKNSSSSLYSSHK